MPDEARGRGIQTEATIEGWRFTDERGDGIIEG
jgi:hypothetical protein